MTEQHAEQTTTERLKRLEAAIAKVSSMDDSDVAVLIELARRERDRRVVDQWLAELATRIVSRGKWIVAVTGLFYFFKDHAEAILVFIFESRSE